MSKVGATKLLLFLGGINMSKKFNMQQLSNYNGLNGKPAYVAYKGKVYDVSKIFQNGEHAGFKAGTDLTGDFGKGPHQEDIFSNFSVVGTLSYDIGLAQRIFGVSGQQADLLLRLALGIVFFAHGAQKLLGWFGGYGWDGTMGFFTQALQIPASLAALAILVEFFGGIFIILGFMTRPAALALSINMLVAAFKVHLASGFFLASTGAADGVEYAFVLVLLSLYLAVKGAGTVSLDKLIVDRLTGTHLTGKFDRSYKLESVIK